MFVDIDPDIFAMASAEIERVITPRTKAIMPVHLYRMPPTWIRFSTSRGAAASS